MRKWRLAVLNKPLQRNSTVKYKNKSILYISYIIIVELRCRCFFFPLAVQDQVKNGLNGAEEKVR